MDTRRAGKAGRIFLQPHSNKNNWSPIVGMAYVIAIGRLVLKHMS